LSPTAANILIEYYLYENKSTMDLAGFEPACCLSFTYPSTCFSEFRSFAFSRPQIQLSAASISLDLVLMSVMLSTSNLSLGSFPASRELIGITHDTGGG